MQAIFRSYLYATASKIDLVQKAFKSEADAVIVDLEDGVPVNKKDESRQNLVSCLSGNRQKPVFIRTNPLDSPFVHQDIEVAAQLQPTGIRIPKVHNAQQVSQVCAQLRKLGFKGSLQLQIESALGILSMQQIAQADPMITLIGIGEEDLRADLRCERFMLQPLLLQVVVVSRAVNLQPPLMSVYPYINDEKGFRESTIWGKQAGFFGRITVHPCQIPIIHEILTPTQKEIDYAYHVLDKLEEAFSMGQTTIRDNNNNYISIWTKRHAENVLFLKEQITNKTSSV